MHLGPSELILNADHSIYHLNLHPQDIANTILTVGDPDRVAKVSQYFDSIEIKKGKREFVTHTGYLNKQRISVVSTGIGTDNVDIVLNELDALVNLDFDTRQVKQEHTRLRFIRIGTSGAIQPDIAVNSFLLSEYVIGFDTLLHFYKSDSVQYHELSKALVEHLSWPNHHARPYAVKCDEQLAQTLRSNRIRFSTTVTNTGFYGPQGRTLRLALADSDLVSKLASFEHNGSRIANLEMETSGIYGLSKLMGHQAVSLNCILANRATGNFSKNPEKAIDELIQYTLGHLTMS